MATPAESTTEQIAAALETRLAGIEAGATYWYTPEKVARCAYFDEAWLSGLEGPVYLIRPGEEQIAEANTGQMRTDTEFFVLVAVQDENATSNPFTIQEAGATSQATLVNRCVRDVIVSLMSDVQLGGLALNVFENPADVTRDFFISGRWLCAEIRFTVSALPLKATL